MPQPPHTLNRRQFGLSSLGGLALSAPLEAEGGWDKMPWTGPARVKKVYVAVNKPTWPRPTIEVEQTMAQVDAKLVELERKHPDVVRFSGGELVRTMEDANTWVKRLEGQEADGNLVITITSGSDGMVEAIGRSGLPTLLFLRPYAGHAWASFSAFSQAGNKADVLASSDYGDLDVYMRIFHTIHQMRKSKVIVVAPGAGRSKLAEEFSKQFGATFSYLSYADLRTAYDAVDARQAGQEAERYTRGALRVVEPTPENIQRALRFYLGVKNLLKQQQANAITIDCLGGITRGDLPGYPCVAWSRLNDQGLYGVCQADLQCTMTQLLLTSFSGKPGFLFNPVFDTSRNEILHTHCVAPTSMRGIGAPPSPYILRSHLEMQDGLSLQVLLPIGETMTVAKFDHPRRFMVSTAEVIGNVESDSGCRTQIRTRVKDAGKMLANFKAGVHRVSYYGDFRGPIQKMGRLMGFEVVHEM